MSMSWMFLCRERSEVCDICMSGWFCWLGKLRSLQYLQHVCSEYQECVHHFVSVLGGI